MVELEEEGEEAQVEPRLVWLLGGAVLLAQAALRLPFRTTSPQAEVATVEGVAWVDQREEVALRASRRK